MGVLVYRLVNKVTSDTYIGVASFNKSKTRGLARRFDNHSRAITKIGFNIRLYGKDCFIKEIVASFRKKESAHAFERRLIQKEKPTLNVLSCDNKSVSAQDYELISYMWV